MTTPFRRRDRIRQLRSRRWLRWAVTATALLLVPPTATAETLYDVTAYGAVGDGTTNDSDAFNAAYAAAALAGGGVVYVPCGSYRIGKPGPNNFYTGLRIRTSNIEVRGDGVCSTLLPGFTNGGAFITICDGAGASCLPTNEVTDVLIRGLRFYDDDPELHCGWNGWVCLYEETHGVYVTKARRIEIRDSEFDSIGDESVDILTENDTVTIQGNTFLQCPSLPSGGSCVSVSGSSHVDILDNHFQGGISYSTVAHGNRMIDIANNALPGQAETTDILIAGNLIEEVDAPPAPPAKQWANWVNTGILIHSGNNHIRRVEIRNNTIKLDLPGRYVTHSGGSSYERVDIDIHDNIIEGGIFMEATNLTVANNSISGGAGFDGVRGAGDDDTENHAMMLGGTNVVVRDNHVDGNGGSCLFITRATGFDVADNDCIGTSAGLFGNPGKFHVITSHWYQPQWMTGIVIERNLLEPVFTLGTDQTCDDDCWGRTTCGPDDPQACDSYVADGIHVDGTILTVVRSNTITAVGGDAISGAWLEESNQTGAENVGCAGTAPAPECVPALPSFGTGILFISILAVSAAAIPLFLGVRRSR